MVSVKDLAPSSKAHAGKNFYGEKENERNKG